MQVDVCETKIIGNTCVNGTSIFFKFGIVIALPWEAYKFMTLCATQIKLDSFPWTP